VARSFKIDKPRGPRRRRGEFDSVLQDAFYYAPVRADSAFFQQLRATVHRPVASESVMVWNVDQNLVLQRSFKNNSMMLFSFALLDSDRVRGVSADRVCIDEVQDMDPDHVPIIQETMSYSKWVPCISRGPQKVSTT
jgi:hypothetical protein